MIPRSFLRKKINNRQSRAKERDRSSLRKADRMKALSLFLLLLLMLSACSGPENVVAKVNKKPISLEEFEEADQIAKNILPQKSYADPEEKLIHERDRQKEVLQMLAWEAMIREDASSKGLDVDSASQKLWDQTMEEFGDEKSLKIQLDSLGISEIAFKSSLRREALIQVHRKKIAEELAPTEEELKKFYQKHQEKCALISYVQVSLPTHAEAKELAKSWKKDPSIIPDSEAKYNGDLFENTRFDQFSNVGIHDPRLADPEIFKQKKGTVNWYYSNNLYYVISMTERLTAFSDVESQVRSLYEEESYLNYMKKLAGKLHVHLYEKNLPSMKQKAEDLENSEEENIQEEESIVEEESSQEKESIPEESLE